MLLETVSRRLSAALRLSARRLPAHDSWLQIGGAESIVILWICPHFSAFRASSSPVGSKSCRLALPSRSILPHPKRRPNGVPIRASQQGARTKVSLRQTNVSTWRQLEAPQAPQSLPTIIARQSCHDTITNWCPHDRLKRSSELRELSPRRSIAA